MRHSILIVEDELDIQSILQFVLEDEGYVVHTAERAEDGWVLLQQNPIDLVLLDINLPGMDGLSLCNQIKTHHPLPVMILSSRDRDDDVISGLELGADDYIKKPFNHRELILRIANLLGRSSPEQELSSITTGALAIDLLRERVLLDGKEVSLSPIEYGILLTLARNMGRIISWQVLCREVWGKEDWEGGHELVKVNIRRLRKKIEPDPSEPVYIRNEWGRGYRLVEGLSR